MPAADPGPIAGPGDSSPRGWVPGDAAVAGRRAPVRRRALACRVPSTCQTCRASWTWRGKRCGGRRSAGRGLGRGHAVRRRVPLVVRPAVRDGRPIHPMRALALLTSHPISHQALPTSPPIHSTTTPIRPCLGERRRSRMSVRTRPRPSEDAVAMIGGCRADIDAAGPAWPGFRCAGIRLCAGDTRRHRWR